MNKPKSIMVVDDDRLDVLTLSRVMNGLNAAHLLQSASTGEEALQLLAENEQDLPKIIVMDLNMPRMNGIELLTTLKAHPVWRRIPVIVLTTSNQEHERRQCFDLSVAGYIVKPVSYSAFVEVVKTIYAYWCINELYPTG